MIKLLGVWNTNKDIMHQTCRLFMLALCNTWKSQKNGNYVSQSCIFINADAMDRDSLFLLRSEKNAIQNRSRKIQQHSDFSINNGEDRRKTMNSGPINVWQCLHLVRVYAVALALGGWVNCK